MNIVKNERKTDYLLSAIQAFNEVDEDFLVTADYDQVYDWLTGIKGIGDWSATFILLRGLGRMEKVPLSEKRLLEAVRQHYGRHINEKKALEIAAGYGDAQGYWAHYLRASGLFS